MKYEFKIFIFVLEIFERKKVNFRLKYLDNSLKMRNLAFGKNLA